MQWLPGPRVLFWLDVPLTKRTGVRREEPGKCPALLWIRGTVAAGLWVPPVVHP